MATSINRRDDISFGVITLGAAGVLVFGGLKMLAEVIMHVVEHRMLAGRKPR